MKQSNIIKVLVMNYFRFAKQWDIVCTELENGHCDVFAMSSLSPRAESADIEVKISMNDLKRELRKTGKHRRDLLGNPVYTAFPRPEYFYFALPARLWESAKPFIEEHFPHAGVLVIDDYKGYFKDERGSYALPPVRSVKQPAPLWKEQENPLGDIHGGRSRLEDLPRSISNSLCNYSFHWVRANLFESDR